MKTRIHHLILLAALMAALGLIPASRVTAQTFTTVHTFSAFNGHTNNDGATPRCKLILSGNTLYGTAGSGGVFSYSSVVYGMNITIGDGTVFAVHTDGTGFTVLHNFTAPSSNSDDSATNSDGTEPEAGLVLSGNTLYGTATSGGSSGNGTIFAVNTDGTGFTVLYSFTNGSDGNMLLQAGELILSGNTLYGTADGNDTSGGTVFAIHTDGTGFTVLHTFTATSGSLFTNSDGASLDGLILSGNTLYGTAGGGGSSGNGTIFAVNTDGTGFTVLHSFTGSSGSTSYNSDNSSLSVIASNLVATLGSISTNGDGTSPEGLVLSGNTLYGTASRGGSSSSGTVFKINTDGTGFTLLHAFAAVSGSPSTNSDGKNPNTGLMLSGNTLYGTAEFGGSSGEGTAFAVNTDGTGFTVLHTFTAEDPNTGANSDGTGPQAGLVLSGNTMYGTASFGGSNGNGTVFSLTLSAHP